MTERPEVLPETPPAPSDLLSDLLGSMHLSGTVLFRAEFHEPWSVLTPDSCQLAQTLPFRTEHIIPFHLFATGGCWIEMEGHEPVWLDEADAVLLPYGDPHCLRGHGSVDTVELGPLLPQGPWQQIPVVAHGGPGDATEIICGFLQCDELLFHPILRHLPSLLHVGAGSDASNDWLAGTIRHTIREASKPMPGSRSMLRRLTEVMFVEILRSHLQNLSADEVGWFAALNDPVAGAALQQLHAAPMKDWTIEKLAREAGVSRTVLAQRFKHFLDLPPMRYLAQWRLQLAAQQMKTSDVPLKTIVDGSGYESEAAFSRAFKRHFGLPPGDWRKRQNQH